VQKRDEAKQDALYVRVASDGGVATVPVEMDARKLETEMERAARFKAFCDDFLNGEVIMWNPSFRFLRAP
jgi:hypothetical protein